MQAIGTKTNHPPLAKDASGRLIAIPEGTASWRLSRNTGGRPRIVVGADMQPVRFPLTVTLEDVLEVCGAGSYRVCALDEFGAVLDFVTLVQVGDAATPPANTNATDVPRIVANTDLRFALETIATIARAQSESVKAVVDAQAEWIKALAQNKAMPRNAAFPMLPPPEPPPVIVEEDEDDEEEEAEPPKGGVEQFLGAITPFVPSLLAEWSGRSKQKEPTKSPMRHIATVRKQLTPLESKYLDALLDDKAADNVVAALAALSVDDAVDKIRHGAAGIPRAQTAPTFVPSPELIAKIMSVRSLLDATIQERLARIAPRIIESPDAAELAAMLEPMKPADAAVWIAANIDDLETRFA